MGVLEGWGWLMLVSYRVPLFFPDLPLPFPLPSRDLYSLSQTSAALLHMGIRTRALPGTSGPMPSRPA